MSTRPSVSVTRIWSSSHRTERARAGSAPAPEVPVTRAEPFTAVLLHLPDDGVILSSSVATGARDLDERSEPDLGAAAVASDVYVRRFSSVVRPEPEPIAILQQQGRQPTSAPREAAVG